ncbi:serine/threonine protein kinase [Dictyobacter kobayashii]|uniref:Protein kinase domain-containing protein n=1 Tax=Dictyobacter kobayashii TaxID=2014872 RepID=A0A402AKJ7_9CHLR|nr:serine/threonine-protein kinase [Dictyobacter kobayashii]GCE19613.1 hypothetical protein KDK_34130 [Dictyobacter kobayashii]
MGKDTNLFCAECGGDNPLHAKFCRFCGYRLNNQTDNSIPRAPTTSAHQAVVQPLSTSTPQPLKVDSLLKQRYRIVKEIGSGGYGKVYRAIDTEFMDRQVAIKEMIQHGLSTRELVEAAEGFKREAVLLARLTHPNLPSIYDYFSEHGNWYLVMSYIEGETLESYARYRGGSLPIDKVIQIGIQLATVLSFLHTRRPSIIFRDLKPANVMRTPEGQIYLIDFGIARHFKHGQTKDTMVLGSPGYAAPEQYGRAQTTPQTDVYSLGVVLYQLITGIDPSISPFGPKPMDLPKHPQLKILIQCMLEMDPKRRPASMGNIQRELQRIVVGKVINGSQPGQRQPPAHRAFQAQMPSSYPSPSIKRLSQSPQTPLRASVAEFDPASLLCATPSFEPQLVSTPPVPVARVGTWWRMLDFMCSVAGFPRGKFYLPATYKKPFYQPDPSD